MHFNSALFTTFLFVSAVLAIRRRGSQLLDPVEKTINATSDGVEYTSTWAGAVCRQDTGTIVMVSGVITVPDMSAVEADSAASAWVGIDGDTCKNAALQTGVVFGHAQNGHFYQAMYWSFPDTAAVAFKNITISAGDVVRLMVGAFADPTVLQFTLVENLSNKQSAITFQNNSQELCGQNAEWVIEDYAQEGIPFANFGTVTFTDASALSEGLIFGPLEATILEIKQNGQVLTSVSVDNSTVTIKYL